jgi:hypothetical protein
MWFTNADPMKVNFATNAINRVTIHNTGMNIEGGLTVDNGVKASRVSAGVGVFYTSLSTQVDPYAAGWEDNVEVATKGDLFDKIEAIAAGGEVNTASNLAGDEGIFFQKAVSDLEFKSLSEGANITLTSDNDTITITAAAGSVPDPLTVNQLNAGRVHAGPSTFYTQSDLAAITVSPGSTINPAITSYRDDDTGISWLDTSMIFSAGNSATMQISNGSARMYKPFRLDNDNDVTSPDLCWADDTNTGLYQFPDVGDDSFAIACGGVYVGHWAGDGLHVLDDVKASRVEAGIASFYTHVKVDGYVELTIPPTDAIGQADPPAEIMKLGRFIAMEDPEQQNPQFTIKENLDNGIRITSSAIVMVEDRVNIGQFTSGGYVDFKGITMDTSRTYNVPAVRFNHGSTDCGIFEYNGLTTDDPFGIGFSRQEAGGWSPTLFADSVTGDVTIFNKLKAGRVEAGTGLFYVGLGIPRGTASKPGLYFKDDTNTGLRQNDPDTFLFVAGGTDVASLTSSGDMTFTGQVYAHAGTNTNASYSWSGDAHTGMYRYASDVVGITAGGTDVAQFAAGGLTVSDDLHVTNDVVASRIHAGSSTFYTQSDEAAVTTEGNLVVNSPAAPNGSSTGGIEVNTGGVTLNDGAWGDAGITTGQFSSPSSALVPQFTTHNNRDSGISVSDTHVKIWEKGDLCATFNGTNVVLFDDLQLRKTGTSSNPDLYFNDASRDPGVHFNLDNGAHGWGWSANDFELGYWTEDDQDLHITNSIRVAAVEAGTGIFYTYLTVGDEVYGSDWNGSLEVPTKNALWDKIETIAGGGVPEPLLLSDGSDAAPALAFTNDETTGIYWDANGGPGALRFAVAGSRGMQLNSAFNLNVEGAVGAVTSVNAGTHFRAGIGGSATEPSFRWLGDSLNTGIYEYATDEIGFSNNGVYSGRFDVNHNLHVVDHLFVADGAVGDPTIAFESEQTTGMYRDPTGAGAIRWAVGGVKGMQLNSALNLNVEGGVGAAAAVNAGTHFRADIDGAVGEPSFRWLTDITTGMYYDGGEIKFAIGGVQALRLTASPYNMVVTGAITAGAALIAETYIRVNAPGTFAAPAYRWEGDTNTGLYQVADGDGSIAFSCNGARAGYFDINLDLNVTDSLHVGDALDVTNDIDAARFKATGNGLEATPAFTWVDHPDSGMFIQSNGDDVRISAGGVQSLACWKTAVVPLLPVRSAAGGDEAGPDYSFNGNDDTGMFSPADEQVGFTCAGTQAGYFAASDLYVSNDIHATGAVNAALASNQMSRFGVVPSSQLGTDTADTLVSTKTSATGGGGGIRRGGLFSAEWLGVTSSTTSTMAGINCFARTATASDQDMTSGANAAGNLVANRCLASSLGTGSVAMGGAVAARCSVNDGSGEFTEAYAFFDEGGIGGSGNGIVNYRGLWVGESTGNVATKLGVQIDALTNATTNIGLKIDGCATNNVWLGATGTPTTEAGGIVWGSGKDVNLYRSGNDELTTDDAFVCDTLTVGGTPITGDGGGANTARNLILNGAAMINQRGPCTAANTFFSNGDFVWCLDHVLLVSDGADAVDVLQNTAAIPAGASHCFELDTETSNKKFGLLFPLESLVAAELLSPDDDRVCSITFKYKATAGVQNIRAQVLSFTGAVDALVDPINDWVAGTADSDPTYVASWTEENAGTQIATTTEWQTYTLENVAIDTAGAVNVALLIHVADIDLLAGTDKIYIADVHLNEGATVSAYVRPTLRIEFDECARFMMKSFEQAVTPDTNTSDFDGTLAIMNSNGTNDDDFIYQVRFPAPMHHQPDVTYFSPGEDSADWWNENDGNSDGPSVTIDRCATSFIAHAATASATPGERYHIHYVAISEIIAS